ncbi:MAG: ATP-binding protein [Tepidisphaeraceae bacterium]|jgi:signal transduction histidine kinase
MFGLRQKLMLGFGGLLLILLTVSVLGIAVSRQHRNELDKFLYENWRSVEYGQKMVDALARLQDTSLDLAAQQTPASVAAAKAVALPAIQEFDENVNAEDNNITLPHEDEIAAKLTLVWFGTDLKTGQKVPGDCYRDAYMQLLDPGLSPDARARAYATVRRLAPDVKTQSQAVIDLNLANMTPVEGRIKSMADDTSRLMIVLSLFGAGLAVLFTMMMARSILEPVKAITRSAQEIEQGNLDLVVHVKSRDELRKLAEAFNSMAAKLREYRRTNRAKLERTQQSTQNAINSLPDAVAILTPDGNVEMANFAAQKLFALHADAHVTQQRAPWLVELFNKTTADLRPVQPRDYASAVQVLDENGGERFFLPHSVPVLDEEGALLGVTVVLADVTNLRRLDEMKSGMLSVVSHELKTPLTSIRMGVHLLLEERLGSLTGAQNDILSAVREDSDRLNRIVENLLDMGRIESGREMMELRPESGDKIVTEATEPLMTAFHDKGVSLTTEIPDDLPPVMVDNTRIGHVFSNLLGNALKYTPPGGQVRISAAPESGGFVRFTVADTGPGIPNPFLSKIFERFFRVPGQPGQTGAGMGLAIAREIVEAHGGRVNVESKEGEGSKFSFTLHVAPPVSTSGGLGGSNGETSAREVMST